MRLRFSIPARDCPASTTTTMGRLPTWVLTNSAPLFRSMGHDQYLPHKQVSNRQEGIANDESHLPQTAVTSLSHCGGGQFASSCLVIGPDRPLFPGLCREPTGRGSADGLGTQCPGAI